MSCESIFSTDLASSANTVNWCKYREVQTHLEVFDGKKLQYTTFTPLQETGDATLYVGGIPPDPAHYPNMKPIPSTFGHIAAKLACHAETPSLGVILNWPGTSRSEGNAWDLTINGRVEFLQSYMQYIADRHDVERFNLVGSSLGGYLLALLLEDPQHQISMTVLASPSAYPQTSHDIPYGSDFKEVISQPWQDQGSPAWDILQSTSHKVLLTNYEYDSPVIPKNIQDGYEQCAAKNNTVEHVVFPGITHGFKRPGQTEFDYSAIRSYSRLAASAIAAYQS